MKIFSGLPLDPSILKIPLEFATSMIDWKVENDEFHPNLTFCRLDNDDEETMRKFSELHSLMRRHHSELGSFGHSGFKFF